MIFTYRLTAVLFCLCAIIFDAYIKKAEGLANIYIDSDKFSQINKITKGIHIEKCDDFINLLKRNTKILSNEQQNFILDFIFRKDEKSKEKKRDLLKNNYEKILLIYQMYVIRQGFCGLPISVNHFYNIIVASRIFFETKDIFLDHIKYKIFNKQNTVDDRRKQINSLFYQIIKDGPESVSVEKFNEVLVYLEIIEFIIGRYYCLFNLQSQKNINLLNECMCIYQCLYNLWDNALNIADKAIVLSKKGVSQK